MFFPAPYKYSIISIIQCFVYVSGLKVVKMFLCLKQSFPINPVFIIFAGYLQVCMYM